MIDRDARNAVVAALEDYQLERITAFEFDERIFDVADKSRDQTVRECVDALWGFYDDCTDHRVVAEKYEWDIWERLRLLLLSDAELEAERSGRAKRALLPVCGLVAMLGVVVLVWSVWRGHGVLFALGLYLLLCAVVTWRARASDAATEKKDAPYRMAPFASLAQMRRAVREVPGFRKQRYPRRLSGRVVPRSWLSQVVAQGVGFLGAPMLLGMMVMATGGSGTTRVVWPGD
jgi:hypothetical protein